MARSLQYRTNNGYDSVLLLEGHTVIGAWTVTPETLETWDRPGDLDDWSPTWPDDADPEAYGDLVETRAGA
jgi:hypothetical protein